MLEYIQAAIKLGLPLLLMSWWVYSALYRKKLINKNADRGETERAVKNYRKEFKQAEKAKKAALKKKAFSEVNSEHEDDYWTAKWMRFGGGFYGLTAVWTFLYLEVKDIWQFIVGFPAFVEEFSGGAFDLLLMFLKNQVMNFASAFSWIVQWADGFSLIYFLSAYLGYWAGQNLAKKWDAKRQLARLFVRLKANKKRFL